MYKNKNISQLVKSVTAAFIVVVVSAHCANPVPPMGGDKDTTRPTLIMVSNKPKENQQIIRLEFNENIQTTNTPVVSPIVKVSPNQTNTTTERRNIQISTPNTTNTIYLKGFIYDLNENNTINQPALLLKKDTGQLVVTTPPEDIKTKKLVFIRDANRYRLQLKQTDSALIYLPNTTDNVTYHFHGLTDSLHILYVIYEDNDYSISNHERANCFYTINNHKDTIIITTPSKTKHYKTANNYRDSLYLITEPTVDISWFNKNLIHYYNRDTLIVLNKNINVISDALHIDSFLKTQKVSSYIDNQIYYHTAINSFDTIRVKPFYHYPLLVDIKQTDYTIPNIKCPPIKVGLINVINPNTFTINIAINIGSTRFFLSLPTTKSKSFYLPEGTYNYNCWLPTSDSALSLSPSEIDYQNQIPLVNPEYIYIPIKPIVVSSKIENTLILPTSTSFNTRTISK